MVKREDDGEDEDRFGQKGRVASQGQRRIVLLFQFLGGRNVKPFGFVGHRHSRSYSERLEERRSVLKTGPGHAAPGPHPAAVSAAG